MTNTQQDREPNLLDRIRTELLRYPGLSRMTLSRQTVEALLSTADFASEGWEWVNEILEAIDPAATVFNYRQYLVKPPKPLLLRNYSSDELDAIERAEQ
jgi:hypothetical protein